MLKKFNLNQNKKEMNNKSKILYLSSALILVGAYFVFRHFKEKEKQLGQVLDYSLLLQKGSRGKEVEELQRKLGDLDVDGVFGSKTEARLKEVYQVTKTKLSDLI